MLKKFWTKLSNIGIHSGLSKEETLRLNLTSKASFIVIITLLFYLIIELLIGIAAYFSIAVIFSELCLVSILFLLHHRFYNSAKFLLFFITILIAAYFTIMLGGQSREYILLIPLSTIPLLIFDSERIGRNLFLCTLIIYILIHIIYENISKPIDLSYGTKILLQDINIIVGFVVTFGIVYVFKHINEEYGRSVLKQKEVIESKNEEIFDSMVYAKKIQSAILPSISYIEEHFDDSFILNLPKDVVSGDFYWMEEADGFTCIAAADCTGHGIPGAMVSVVCANALSKSVVEEGITDPGKILDRSREIIIEKFSKTTGEVKDGMDISLCAIDQKNGTVFWAGAHNPLLVIRPSEKKQELYDSLTEKYGAKNINQLEMEEIKNHILLETKANKQPVGRYENESPFQTYQIPLKKGDQLYMFSDGFQDQFGGKNGKKFKSKNFKKLLLKYAHFDMKEQKTIIENQFDQWKGPLEQIDDVCVVGIRL